MNLFLASNLNLEIPMINDIPIHSFVQKYIWLKLKMQIIFGPSKKEILGSICKKSIFLLNTSAMHNEYLILPVE